MTKQIDYDDPVKRGLAILAASKHDDTTLAELVLRFFVFRRYFPAGQEIASSTMRDVREKEFTIAVLKEIDPDDLLVLPLPFWVDELEPVDDVDELIGRLKKKLRDLRKTTSVGIMRSLGGKIEKRITETLTDDRTGKSYDSFLYVLKYGRIKIDANRQRELWGDDFNGLNNWEKKLLDTFIQYSDNAGRVYVLSDRAALLDHLGLSNAGKNWKKIRETVIKFIDISFEPLMPIEKNKNGKKYAIRFTPEPLLSPVGDVVELDTGKVKGSIPLVRLPRLISEMKNENIYLIHRDPKWLKLPDHVYGLLVHIHEFFRMNLGKAQMPGRNLSTWITETDWTISARREKRAIENFHDALDLLISVDALGGYRITQRGSKEALPLKWYDRKSFPLTVVRNKRADVNHGTLQQIIYHFEPTQTFLDDHQAVIRGRKLPKKELD